MDAVEPWLQAAEGTGRGEEDIRGYLACIRAYVVASRGEIGPAVALAREAMQHLPAAHATVRAFTAAILSSLYRFQGDFAAAAEAIRQAIAISQDHGDSTMLVLTRCNLGATLIVLGQLERAAATFREAMQTAEALGGRGTHRLPFTGLASTGMAAVLRERNDLDGALRYAGEGIALSRRWGQVEAVIHGNVELAQVLQARGDAAGARTALQEARAAARDLASWSIISLDAIAARLSLQQGDLPAAARWAQESGVRAAGTPSFAQVTDHIVLARILLAQGALWDETGRARETRLRTLDEASALLARLLAMVDQAGAAGYAIEVLVLQAVACRAQGKAGEALACVERALALAEREGHVRVFVEAGAAIAPLLVEAARQGVAVDHVARLLAALREEGAVDAGGAARAAEALIEPLSERELEVLRLIVAGLSNKEIAEELVLATGTVKKHINNIYGKLGVHRRAQAIRRAQDLALV
jgi:LuxR family maltose regulon positive regulatory protein